MYSEDGQVLNFIIIQFYEAEAVGITLCSFLSISRNNILLALQANWLRIIEENHQMQSYLLPQKFQQELNNCAHCESINFVFLFMCEN